MFVALELRRAAPMLDLHLFRVRAFAGTAAVAFLQSVAIYPLFLFLPLCLQDVLGYGPFETGSGCFRSPWPCSSWRRSRAN